MKELETRNLFLKRFTKDNLKKLYYEIKNSKELSTNIDFKSHSNLEVMKAIIECTANSGSERHAWVMIKKEDNQILGYIKIEDISYENEFCRFVCVTIPKYDNEGEYSIETLNAVMNYLENEKSIKVFEIQIYSNKDKIARPILEKIGFIREAVLKNRRYNENEKNFEDLIIYTLFR